MKTSARRLVGALAAPAALLLALTACGGAPSRDSLVDELKDQGLTDTQAECMADAVFDAGLSEDGLETVAESSNISELDDLSGDDKAAWEKAQKAMIECAM